MFIYRLLYDKPYRNLFYKRIGRIHFLFSWLLFPRCSSLKINQNMKLGKHCHLEHSTQVHLNAQAIGDDFTCLHNVTIGQKKGLLPTIGNKVLISAGACVIGGINVGNNVIIGNNCVVVHDVPSNSTIIGNPAIIVKLNGKRVNIPLSQWNKQNKE